VAYTGGAGPSIASGAIWDWQGWKDSWSRNTARSGAVPWHQPVGADEQRQLPVAGFELAIEGEQRWQQVDRGAGTVEIREGFGEASGVRRMKGGETDDDPPHVGGHRVEAGQPAGDAFGTGSRPASWCGVKKLSCRACARSAAPSARM